MAAALVPIGHVDALGSCHYSEQRPTGRLPGSVAQVWRSEVWASGALLVVPDGCVELVRAADGSVEVWGPAVRSREVLVERGAGYDGVRLRAGAAANVLGLTVADFGGAVVPAAGVGSLGRLGALDRERWLARVLELAEDGTAAWRRDAVASRAPGMLARPGARVASVATALGIGERHLHRRFCQLVGMSPSAYRRLVRTRHALRDLSSPASGPVDTIAAIAHRRGFTDQSHLTREVVALTGRTPARLR